MGVYLGPLYQQVEYIQSTATNPGADNSSGQCIDTLYTHNSNTKISIDMQFTTTAKQQRLFGVSTANSSYSTFVAYINGSTQWARATKDGDGNWQTTSVSADTNRHTFVLQNSNYVIYTNGATTYSGNNGNTMTKGGSHTLPLLCTWGDGDGKYLCHASAKLYSCKIWDNGTLVRDFVPCYRKSDNVIGVFDKVENKFYTNAGSGTFIKGNDVRVLQPELKNAYIGEYTEGRQPGANTVAYRPLNSTTTVNDQSGNNYNLTNTGSVTFGTYKGVNCAYFSGSNKLTTTSFVSNQQAVTVSCWMYYISNGQSGNGNYNQFTWRWGGSSANFGPYIDIINGRKFVCSPGGIGTQYPVSDSSRKYVTVTFNGSNTIKMYMNGVLDGTNSSGTVPSGSRIGVGGYTANNTNVRKGGISEVIVENKVRTDQEIADYYNRKKSNYGL